MSGNGETPKVAAIRFERLLPDPIERVWDFVTALYDADHDNIAGDP